MSSKAFRITIAVMIGLTICSLYILRMYRSSQPTVIINGQTVTINGHSIAVELETTEDEWYQGLSGRTSLAPQTGMLFVFNKEGRWSMWMKDMLFPIDMIWITRDKHIVKIQENATPDSYTNGQTMFQPDQDVLYVLEVPAGTVKEYGITVG
jgi:uncharacterized membrane protein (UPF0127 family)